MKALIFTAPRCVSLQEKSKPAILLPTDAIIKITKTTICGTDLHILRGDVGTCQPGRVLGHEGVGVVETVGESVNRFKPGDHVLVSCITSCATCLYCRQEMYSHCISGGWLLGNTIDGTQAEYTRIPHADSSLYRIPVGVDEAAMVMLSDVFPTALECGVKNGRVCPGAVVAIVGSGPVGLAALMTAQMYSPLSTIVIDKNNDRLMVAKKFGADHTINNHTEDTWARIRAITSGRGCDVVVEAVGLSATFELCQKLLAPGGTLANIGVHGGPATLHLERLWDRNIAITTRLVDTVSVPLLIRELQAGKLQPSKLITHEFRLEEMEEAYKTFAEASQNGALKMLVQVGEEVEDNDFW